MTTRDQILSFIFQNRKMLLEKYHITRIGLFGSYARGEQKDSNDIDLLVEFEENTPDLYDLKLQLKDFFIQEFGIETDICREKYIKIIASTQSLKAIDRINEYTSGYKSADEFNEDYRNFDATMMNFVVIGEMVESDENERSCQRPPVAQKQKLPLTAGQLALIEADYQHFGFHAVKMSQRNRTTHSSFILDLIY